MASLSRDKTRTMSVRRQDWHIGDRARNDQRSWLQDSFRGRDAEQALQSFLAIGPTVVLQRGTVSKMHRLEPPQEHSDSRHAEHPARLAAHDVAQLTLRALREVAGALPLATLRASGEFNLLAVLALAFLKDVHKVPDPTGPPDWAFGPLEPLKYVVEEAPTWISVHEVTGAVTVKDSLLPPSAEGRERRYTYTCIYIYIYI